jgi:hypothetical protein
MSYHESPIPAAINPSVQNGVVDDEEVLKRIASARERACKERERERRRRRGEIEGSVSFGKCEGERLWIV